jgi:hypothetical protein
VLGIVGEFDHIKAAIVTFNQVSLCSAAHFPDQIAGS